MKKKMLSLILAGLLLASTAGCAQSGAKPAETSAVPSEASPTAEEEAIAQASTTEQLQPLLKQYYKDKNYQAALMAAERILELDPSDDGVYSMKAELLILIMKDANDTLNNMLGQDMLKVEDQSEYINNVSRMFDEAGFGLIIPFVPDYTSTDEINTVGNTGGNLAGSWMSSDFSETWRGLFASQGDWIYFIDYDEGFALYKMRIDGQDKQLVCADGACNINVIGDWIYFQNIGDNNTIYKIQTDGSMKSKITEDSCGAMCVAGDWVYYSNESDEGKIHKIRTDGSEQTPLGESAGYLFIEDEWLYYTTRDEKNLFRVRLDGSEKQALLENQWNIHAQPYDGWIYYMTDIFGLVIMKMRPDGTEPTEVWRYDAKINFFTVSDNRLFVAVRSADEAHSVMGMDLNTMEQVLQLDDSISATICTDKNNNVYFSEEFGSWAWRKIDLETGTANRLY